MKPQCGETMCTAPATHQTYSAAYDEQDPWNADGFALWCAAHAPAGSWPLVLSEPPLDEPSGAEVAAAALDEWLDGRPEVIQRVARQVPPNCYTLNDTGQHAVLHSYSEDGTVTVTTTLMGFLPVEVFGIDPGNLTPCGCIAAGVPS